MAREIELSTMFPGPLLRLDAFEAATFIRVRHQQYPWEDAWMRIMQVGIYQKGPDVSQIGNTWLENLVEMYALRPFQRQEIEQLGGQGAFLPAAWGNEPDRSGMVYSIPWLMDPRVVFYRQDWFAQAGVEPSAAFASPAGFREALTRLRAAGAARYPLAMATGGLTWHNLASWVWAMGGDFRSPDGRRMTLMEPEARAGVVEFFKLFEFIDPAVACKGSYENDQLFLAGGAAVNVTGHWLATRLRAAPDAALPVVREHLGHALPPGGVPYVGGSHLVVWRHSLHALEALELIRHLLNAETLTQLALAGVGFPPLRQVYARPALAGEPLFAGVIASLERGRSIFSGRRWAAVEVRLNDFIDRLWADLFANPTLDVEKEVESRLGALCSRLEKTLLAEW